MNKFWYGYISYFCVTQIDMDLLGKEKYLKAVDMFWMDTKWWYWLILWVVASGFFAFIKEKKV